MNSAPGVSETRSSSGAGALPIFRLRLIVIACFALLVWGKPLLAVDDFAQRLARAPDTGKAAVLNDWAYSVRERDLQLSFEKASAAFRWAEKTHNKEQGGWALALIGWSQCYRGDLAPGEKNLTEALAVLTATGARQKELQALKWMGTLQYQKGDYARALEIFGRVRDQAGDSEEEDVLKADALSNIAIILNRQGNFKKAMENYLEALDIYDSGRVGANRVGFLLEQPEWTSVGLRSEARMT